MSAPGPTGEAFSNRLWARDTSVLLAANVLRSASPVIVLAVLAQLTSQSTVGRYSIVLALTTPIFAVAQLGLRGVYLTIARRTSATSYVIVQGSAVAAGLAVAVVVAAIVDRGLLVAVLLASALKSADAFADLFAGVMQRHRRTPLILVASGVTAVVGSGLAAITIAMTGSIEAAFGALAAVAVLSTLGLLVLPGLRIADRAGEHMHETGVRGIVRAGIPMGVAQGVSALVIAIPQFVLAATAGDAAVGYLATYLYAFAIADLTTATLTQAWIPRLQHLVALDGNGRLSMVRRTMSATLAWTVMYVPVTAAGLAIVGVLFPVLFGADYAMVPGMAIALGASVLLMPISHFAATAVVVRNLYDAGLAVTIAGCAASLLGSITLVPLLGPSGALAAVALSALARGAVALVLLVIAERRADRREERIG